MNTWRNMMGVVRDYGNVFLILDPEFQIQYQEVLDRTRVPQLKLSCSLWQQLFTKQ